MEKGVQRWIIDISKWNPSSNDFSFALSLLPQTYHSSITRFVKMEDRKRALVSLLLQYTLIHEVLGIPYPDIVINRTLEGKPFLECGRFCFDFPNFNFNVSHHGDYVAIASEPLCLVGLDIVNFMIPEKETVPEYIQNCSSYFSSSEWDRIISVGNNEEVLAEFYRYWCLKEAYVKAIGSGLAYGLHKVEFHHTNWASISVKVDGVTNQQWRFWLFNLDKGHSVSIARGHPRLAIESYKRSLKRTKFNEEEYNASEAENIEDLNGDEPIFWPFERKIDWKSEETWKHFTMSPRKDIIKVTALEETVNTNKNLQKPKQGSKDCHNGGHKIREGNTMPSRLRESTKVSAKIVPLNIENQILALKVEEDDIMGSISTCRNLWKDDFTSNGDVPIEKVVGLGEFDGHEGIDSDFNEGVFLLDEAL